MGEYARCLSLARALQSRWPDVRSHFLLSRHAPYATTTPFDTRVLSASVTLAAREFERELLAIRPQLVVFDNAGRTEQLRATQALGAKIVYISSRGKQRYKAFRLRWMRLLDEHWIAYPADLFGALTIVERCKLALLHRPQVRFIDAMLAPCDESTATGSKARPLAAGAVIFVPGGGSAHKGAKELPGHFLDAACQLARNGVAVQFVAGPAFALDIPPLEAMQVLRAPAGAELMAALARAHLVVVNGGDTLLQALIMGKACVALAIAADQKSRVQWCAKRNVIATAPPARLTDTITALLANPARLAQLRANATATGWHDGLPTAIRAMGQLLGKSQSVQD